MYAINVQLNTTYQDEQDVSLSALSVNGLLGDLQQKIGLPPKKQDTRKELLNELYKKLYWYDIIYTMKKIWKPLKGFEKFYKISNEGEVFLIRSNRFSKAGTTPQGYRQVAMPNKDTKFVHRLVAETFIKNPKNLRYINHIDGNKLNNCVSNLEWCTCGDNIRHAHKTGLINNTGENHGWSKLKEKDILEIRKLHKTGNYTYDKIGSIFDISRQHVSIIVRRKQWKHI